MPKWHYDEETEEFHGDDLYFVRHGKRGPIKIGRGDVESRIARMQTGNPEKLSKIGVIENEGYMEPLWHATFNHLNVRGEWFKPEQQLLDAISWATKGEDWIDEAKPSECLDFPMLQSELLDAVDIYRHYVLSGESPVSVAKYLVTTALSRAIVSYNEAHGIKMVELVY